MKVAQDKAIAGPSVHLSLRFTRITKLNLHTKFPRLKRPKYSGIVWKIWKMQLDNQNRQMVKM